VTSLIKGNAGNNRLNTGLITVTGTPTAAGDAITAAALGLTRIEHLDLEGAYTTAATPATAVLPVYDKANGKIVFFDSGDAAGNPFPDEADDLSDYVLRFAAFGV
jgi:hypothetical protein